MQEGVNLSSQAGTYADQFGVAVALDDPWAFVGASNAWGNGLGAVYVYRFDAASGWSKADYLPAQDTGDHDLYAAALDADQGVLVVGSPKGRPALNYGKWGLADIYRYEAASDTWEHEQRLGDTASWSGHRDMLFGSDVAIEGDTIVVGAENRHARGAAYAYRYTPWADAPWTFTGAVYSDIEEGDFLGASLAISDAWMAVGAPEGDALWQPESGVADTFGEVFVYRLPQVAGNGDADTDGLPDMWEWLKLKHLSTDADEDADNDGRDQWYEFQHETDPANGADGGETIYYVDHLEGNNLWDGLSWLRVEPSPIVMRGPWETVSWALSALPDGGRILILNDSTITGQYANPVWSWGTTPSSNHKVTLIPQGAVRLSIE